MTMKEADCPSLVDSCSEGETFCFQSWAWRGRVKKAKANAKAKEGLKAEAEAKAKEIAGFLIIMSLNRLR